MIEGKSKIAFVINPISGRGKAMECQPVIRKMFDDSYDIRIVITKSAGDGTSIAKQAVVDGYDTVVAVGGDGTVNEVGQALIGSDVKLGIIPLGSGNGLARHLNIPLNPKAAIETIKGAKSLQIDTGSMNDQVFLNAAGIGLDAEVSKLFSSSKKRGLKNYLKIILGLISKQREFDVSLNSGNQIEKMSITMLTVANSTQYGNNAIIAPMADISDGKLDICILRSMNYMNSFLFLTALMSGGLKPGKSYNCYQSKGLVVESDEQWAHVDGEPVKIEGNLVFKSNPTSLSVIC